MLWKKESLCDKINLENQISYKFSRVPCHYCQTGPRENAQQTVYTEG